jgi:uncharacterized protein (TIGR02466 family)
MQFSIPLTPDIISAFGTPVLVRQPPGWEKVNDGIKAQILASREADPGVSVSNRGGWQSSATLWDWPSEEFQAWRGWVHGGLLRMAALLTEEPDMNNVEIDYLVGAWANVNRHGAYNDPHVHPDADWACVYYVACGELEPGWDRNGQFELRDPRIMAQSSKLGGYGFARSLMIDPEPGSMILFPAWMEHGVHPFYGTGDRISIACNIRVTGGRHSGR